MSYKTWLLLALVYGTVYFWMPKGSEEAGYVTCWEHPRISHHATCQGSGFVITDHYGSLLMGLLTFFSEDVPTQTIRYETQSLTFLSLLLQDRSLVHK